MSSVKKLNVGIIGYGLSAKVFHIPFISSIDELTLHSIVQRSPSANNSAVTDHPSAKHFTSAEAFLEDPDVDVVIVSTPPQTHFDFARQALEKGKHVMVEKPLVPTSAEAEVLVGLARTHQRVLCVYQNRRWDADFLTVQKLLRDDSLGRIVEFETHFDRFRPERPTTWKGVLGMDAGGGVLYDLGTHLLDQVLVLFGMPSKVSAVFADQRGGRLVTGEGGSEEPDSATLILSYVKTGTLVFVRLGVMSVQTKQIRFWVRGTRGSYSKTGLDPQEDQLKGGMELSDPVFGREDSSHSGTLCLVQNDGRVVEQSHPSVEPETYLEFYRRFARAVSSGKEADVPVPASQAAQVLRIIEAVKESARTGSEVAL